MRLWRGHKIHAPAKGRCAITPYRRYGVITAKRLLLAVIHYTEKDDILPANLKNTIKQAKIFSVRDTVVSFGVLLCATALCFVLRLIESGTNHVSMIFVLAVFLIARFTKGYFYGIVASLIGVLAVNYIFTYPFFEFNFTISGYPVAMLCMLAVSMITSALTSKAKSNETIRIEVEKEKTRSNLLRAVSHDLRTPLTCILGATSAIIENDDMLTKTERINLLSEVKEDAQWLIRMVENLLAITRIDGENSAKIVKKQEAAEELVSDTVTKFKKHFPSREVTVSVPDELLMVPMDAVLIEQVLINLMENTVLHGETADKIYLSVTRTGSEAIFEVRDNGVGISAEALPHIFDGRLRKNIEPVADSKRNMGIGLSVCNTIIGAHGGILRAENASGGGAIFRFSLPLKED